MRLIGIPVIALVVFGAGIGKSIRGFKKSLPEESKPVPETDRQY